VDGWHRVEAARYNGAHRIAATITTMSRKEAAKEAAVANLRHGKPLGAKERQKAFKMFIHGGGHLRGKDGLKSYREMGVELGGIGHMTVRNWMKRFFPAIFRRMGGSEEGNPEAGPAPPPTEPCVMEQVRYTVDDLVNLTRLVEDPTDRYRVIQALEAALIDLRKLPHEEPPPEDY
jgi:hypothetical protein